MANEKGLYRKKFGVTSFKKLFSRSSVEEETKVRTLSLPDIFLEEEEGEFWERAPDPIYENVDCISLNRYQLSDSGSDNEYDYCDSSQTQQPTSSSSQNPPENIYAEPDRGGSDCTPAEHHYTAVLPNNSDSISVYYKRSSLILPQSADKNYKNNLEDLILPVENTSSVENGDLKQDHITESDHIGVSNQESTRNQPDHSLEASAEPESHSLETELETEPVPSSEANQEQIQSQDQEQNQKQEPPDRSSDSREVSKEEDKSTLVSQSIVSGDKKTGHRNKLSKKTSYEQIQSKVLAIKQRLELKTHTKQEIFNKYTAQKPKQRPKPKIVIMSENDTGNVNASKFKNIRMMFESQAEANSPGNTATKTPTRSNGNDPLSHTSRNGSAKKRTTTEKRRNPLSMVSNLSTDNRLSVQSSNRSSAVSDVSSSEDEASLPSENDTQDPESDVGEEEQDATFEEEMSKRREESPTVKNRRKRFKIAEELYTTEEVYYSKLSLINEVFRNRLKNDAGEYMFPDKIIREIFMNTHELQNLHVVLRDKLKDRIQNWEMRPRIGDIMKSIAPYFQLYTDYMAKFENAIKTLNELAAKDDKFAQIVKDLEADETHCQKLKISQHMLGPVQRIPRYRMLLEQYIERLEESSPDYPDVKVSLEKVALAANKANDNIAKLENFQLVTQLLSNVSGLGMALERTENMAPMVYIKHGKITKMSRRNVQNRFIFLFSDVILICKIEGHGKYKCSKKIAVSDLRSLSDSSDPNMPHPFELITKKCSFTLGGKDAEDKRKWMEALSRVMAGGQADATSSPQRLGLVAPVWIPDNGVSMCMNCERNFTTILRRHHCRACGKVFCSMCSSNKQWLAFDNKTGRVCDSCNNILSARDGMDEKTRKTRGLTNSNFFSGTIEEPEEHNVATNSSKGTIQSGLISGYVLVKVGPDKDYQKYWCVVRGVLLHLYAGTYDKKAKKEMPLVGWNIAEPEDGDKVQDTTVTLKVGHQGLDPMFLKFTSEAEKEKWYEVLEKATFVD